jgi:hypothetical protein
MEEKPKVTRDNIAKHLIEYQLNLINKTLIDTLDDDNWHFNMTLTDEEFATFEKYALALLRKTFKCNKSVATTTFDWFNLAYGLRIKN